MSDPDWCHGGNHRTKKVEPHRVPLFRIARELGKTVGEIEQTMGGSELLEWFAILDEMPWGSYRDDAVVETMLAHMVLGPNCADPNKAMERAKLPWTKKKSAPVRIVSGRELAASLMAWGWKEVEADA